MTVNENVRINNKVALKFGIVIMIIKAIGYIGAVMLFIVLASTEQFLSGLVTGVITFIVTWFSTLIFEAIAEGLQLLQDIKEKL